MRQLRQALVVAMAATIAAVTGSCGSLGGKLSPARSLSGTWSTPIAVSMNLQSDWCNVGRQTVARQTWMATFIITERSGTSNGIDIEMRITQRGPVTVVASCSGGSSSYIPEPSPLFMQGTISGTTVEMYNVTTNAAYNGSFTTDIMTGQFGLWDCQVYCAGEQSEPQAFILTRVR